MKKLITILILILILSMSVNAKVYDKRIIRLKGDLNNDLKVDMIDLQIASNLAVGYGRISEKDVCIADFNRDKQLTIIDALYIQQTIRGLRPLDLVLC